MLRMPGEAAATIDLKSLPAEVTALIERLQQQAQADAQELARREREIALARVKIDKLNFELAPEETRMLASLSAQYDRLGRLDELLVVRRKELSLTKNVTRRLELRLDLARVMGEIEARSGRHGALHDNLRESPGQSHDSLNSSIARIHPGYRAKYPWIYSTLLTRYTNAPLPSSGYAAEKMALSR